MGIGIRPAAIVASLACAALFGCGGGESSRRDSPVAEYEVHEWGLVHGAAGDTVESSAIPTTPVYVESIADKPVLYFHADAPIALRRVAVIPRDGVVREHWPLASTVPNPSVVRWTGVRIDADACTPRPLPRANERPCSDSPIGADCEASSLAIVRTASARCVRTSAGDESFLFYRSTSRSFVPPLAVGSEPSGAIRIERRRAEEIPGEVLVLFRDADGVHVARTTMRPDVRTVGPAEAIGGAIEGRASIVATMRAIGLDDAEADAFLRAWSDSLFGPTADVEDERAADRISADGTPASARGRSVLYFLPAESADALATLEFDPRPRRVARAIAVLEPVP